MRNEIFCLLIRLTPVEMIELLLCCYWEYSIIPRKTENLTSRFGRQWSWCTNQLEVEQHRSCSVNWSRCRWFFLLLRSSMEEAQLPWFFFLQPNRREFFNCCQGRRTRRATLTEKKMENQAKREVEKTLLSFLAVPLIDIHLTIENKNLWYFLFLLQFDLLIKFTFSF